MSYTLSYTGSQIDVILRKIAEGKVVTTDGDEKISGTKVFDGNVTFNGGFAYTSINSLIINPSYLGINNSEIQTSNTSVEIGGSTGKAAYINRLPSTFYSTVAFENSPNIKADLNFVGSDNKIKMTFNRNGNLYFKDGSAWSINIDDNKKIRYQDSGQLDLRYGDFRITNGYSIFWGDKTANKIYGNGSTIYFAINDAQRMSISNNLTTFNTHITAYGNIKMYAMGIDDNSVTTKKYVDDIFTRITGYDVTKTQVLKHINGTLTWVDE